MNHVSRVLPRLALFGLLLTPFAYSQTLGTVTGEVKDATGAVVAGVEIAARNTETNVVRAVVTNESGLYTIPALNPGMYEVKAVKAGFKAASRTGIELQVQQTARVDFTLDIGQVTEPLKFSAAIHTSQGAVPGAKQRVLAEELVLVFELGLGRNNDGRSQRQQIIKSCRHAITAIELRDDEEQAPLFHRSIVAPLSTKQLRPTDLEVREVIRVMQKAHRVGFGVAHSELNLVLSHVASA